MGLFTFLFFPKFPFHAIIIGLHSDVNPLFPPYTQLSSSGSLHVDSPTSLGKVIDLINLLDTK
jgi:hypothetical protein